MKHQHKFLFLLFLNFFSLYLWGYQSESPYYNIWLSPQDPYQSNQTSNTQHHGGFQVTFSTSRSPMFQQHRYTYEELQAQCLLSYLQSTMSPAEFNNFMHERHMQCYGVSKDFLWGGGFHKGLYNERDFQVVENWIIKAPNLTKDQALAIWQGYCNKRVFGDSKKRAGLQRIIQEYDHRIATKKAEQEAYLKKHQSEQEIKARIKNANAITKERLIQCGLDPAELILIPQNIEEIQHRYKACTQLLTKLSDTDQLELTQQRNIALQKSIDQNFAQSWQEIILSPQADGFLRTKKLYDHNYTTCYGTALQHQLHHEVCNMFELIADKQRTSTHQSMFLDTATECNDASFWANDFEAVHLAIGFQEMARASYQFGAWAIDQTQKYSFAIIEGLLESTYEFADAMIEDPLILFKNWIKAIWFIGEAMVFGDPDAFGASLPCFEKQAIQHAELVFPAIEHTCNAFNNANGPTRIKMLTKFITDYVLQEAALQKFGSATQTAYLRVEKIYNKLDITGALTKEAISVSLIPNTITGHPINELEVALQKATQKTMSCRNSGNKPKVDTPQLISTNRPIHEIISEVSTKFNKKISWTNAEICSEIITITKKIVAETNCVISESIKQNFKSKWYYTNELKKRVSIDYNHILNYEVSFNKDKLGNLEIDFKGGHLHGSTQALADKGLITIIKKEPLPTGCWKYDFKDNFTGKDFTKTEFHPSWSQEKIIEESYKLFENSNIETYQAKKGKLAKHTTIGNQELSITIKEDIIDTNIVTAVPYEIPPYK